MKMRRAVKGLLLGVMAAGMVMAGCNQQTGGENVTKEAGGKAEKQIYEYDTVLTDEMGMEYPHHLEVEIIDGKEAYYRDKTIYTEKRAVILEQKVTYTMTDTELSLLYEDSDYSDMEYAVYFTLENNKVTGVEIENEMARLVKDIVGSYTANSDEYGNMTLTIEKNGLVNLQTDKGSYAGEIFQSDENWEINATSDDFTENLDWFIYLEGDTFAYVNYYESRYGQFRGDYTGYGDLGEIVFHVNEDGTVYCDVTIDGVSRYFYGRISADYDTGEMFGCYLFNDDGYSLDFTFGSTTETLNYFGNLTSPLGAG